MTVAEFEATLTQPDPPSDLPPLLRALWHERRGDWTRAHEITQEIDDEWRVIVEGLLTRSDAVNVSLRKTGR